MIQNQQPGPLAATQGVALIARMTIKFAPEYTRYHKASGKVAGEG